jgi:hypothetical protein
VEATLPILLKQLWLARLRSHWQRLASQAEAQGWSHGQYLYALCEQEAEPRKLTRQQRLLREAHLPWTEALADYDHHHRTRASGESPQLAGFVMPAASGRIVLSRPVPLPSVLSVGATAKYFSCST